MAAPSARRASAAARKGSSHAGTGPITRPTSCARPTLAKQSMPPPRACSEESGTPGLARPRTERTRPVKRTRSPGRTAGAPLATDRAAIATPGARLRLAVARVGGTPARPERQHRQRQTDQRGDAGRRRQAGGDSHGRDEAAQPGDERHGRWYRRRARGVARESFEISAAFSTCSARPRHTVVTKDSRRRKDAETTAQL